MIEDKYHDNYFGAPLDGSAWESKDDNIIVRGCSWETGYGECRSAYREGYRYDYLSDDLGLRLVMDIDTNIDESQIIPSFQATNDITNTIGMKLLLILDGGFYRGSMEKNRYDEEPVYVKIREAFYIGRNEVTQKQWREIMGNNPSSFTGDDLPVERVSWDDIQEFIKKLNDKEGTNKYRLPTNEEWEYAAKAGTVTKYSFGDEESQLGNYAWYNINSNGKTHPVGQKMPNQWGLYDMHGNVGELVDEKINEIVYHYLRGGAYSSTAEYCRSAVNFQEESYVKGDFIGFRIVMEI